MKLITCMFLDEFGSFTSHVDETDPGMRIYRQVQSRYLRFRSSQLQKWTK